MCTFGEIQEPTSRTAWEDWDENVPEHNLTELHWQDIIEIPKEIDTLFILEGKYLSDCIKMQTNYKLKLINSIPEGNVHLYQTDTLKKYVCIIKDYNLVLSSEIVELLKPYLNVSKDVITIQTKPLPEYYTNILSTQSCIIRTICTTKCSKPLDIDYPKLEQPNIISGVSAGVVCWREYMNLPGVAVLCYIEYQEEYQMEEMHTLLEQLNIHQNVKIGPSSVLNSNLYI